MLISITYFTCSAILDICEGTLPELGASSSLDPGVRTSSPFLWRGSGSGQLLKENAGLYHQVRIFASVPNSPWVSMNPAAPHNPTCQHLSCFKQKSLTCSSMWKYLIQNYQPNLLCRGKSDSFDTALPKTPCILFKEKSIGYIKHTYIHMWEALSTVE